MSLEGWIFMVGFRIFDVGLLVLWLVWFFRLRDDDEDEPGGGDDGGGNRDRGPRPGPRPDGRRSRVRQGGRRLRDHGRPWRLPERRRPAPAPAPVPSRVRLPGSPVPATRRAVAARSLISGPAGAAR